MRSTLAANCEEGIFLVYALSHASGSSTLAPLGIANDIGMRPAAIALRFSAASTCEASEKLESNSFSSARCIFPLAVASEATFCTAPRIARIRRNVSGRVLRTSPSWDNLKSRIFSTLRTSGGNSSSLRTPNADVNASFSAALTSVLPCGFAIDFASILREKIFPPAVSKPTLVLPSDVP